MSARRSDRLLAKQSLQQECHERQLEAQEAQILRQEECRERQRQRESAAKRQQECEPAPENRDAHNYQNQYTTHVYFGHVLYALWKVAKHRCAC